MSAATTSPLALAQAFLADVATTEALPGNEDLSRHLSQAVRDLQSHSVREEALRSLAKGRGALARHLDAVAQRQRLGMLAQVARVLVLDALKGAQA